MSTLKRREFLGRTLLISTAAAASAPLLGSVLSGCGSSGGSLTCTNTSGLTPAEVGMRQQLKYTDRSDNPGKVCSGCRFYTNAPDANSCGGCSIVKGPIHPQGSCTSWVAKA